MSAVPISGGTGTGKSTLVDALIRELTDSVEGRRDTATRRKGPPCSENNDPVVAAAGRAMKGRPQMETGSVLSTVKSY